MSDHGYSVANILNQLPRVLAEDKRMAALATAIARALMAHLEEIPFAEIYTRIDELPEAVLDILAYDFKIDWYDYNYPIEAKRNLIKTNYYVHRHLGTIGAVKEAIRSIYPNSEVEEWFDYNGQPFFFRVALNSSAPIIPVSTADILKAVRIYKSTRSHLEAIVYLTTVVIGIAITTGYVKYWSRLCGTYPDRAVQGEIVSGNIVASTSNGGIVYSTRMCGTTPGGLL